MGLCPSTGRSAEHTQAGVKRRNVASGKRKAEFQLLNSMWPGVNAGDQGLKTTLTAAVRTPNLCGL